MTTLRRTEANRTPALLCALKLAGVACAISILSSVTMAHAGDDEDVDPRADESFEQRLIGDLLRGIGGQSLDDKKGIHYRERSPLVVPSKIDLPPPAKESTPKVANWPKDPDVQARREAIEESKRSAPDWDEVKRPLLPSELAGKPSKKKTTITTADDNPGIDNSNIYRLSPSELGFNNGMFSKIFGQQKAETKTFVAEPPRESLTQPPAGYQTPSSEYAYGAGPIKSKTVEPYNPITDKGDPTR
ncbi:MAG: hypothetical protein K2W78_02980 [Xanthobacteraceae bacterium]|nr:hypothetical protein [Xanthobacteraceae bacterium]